MERNDDHVYILLIFIVIVFFIKGLFHILRDNDQIYLTPELDRKLDAIANRVIDISDFIFLVSAIYMLFFRKTTRLYIILYIILLLKAVNHFAIQFSIYGRFNKKTEDKIIRVANKISFVTDYGMLFVSSYLLYKIFR
jgi:hypothetical protein